MMTIKCPDDKCVGVAHLNEIGDWSKVLAMADQGTLSVGCPKCGKVWLPENQPMVAVEIRKYLSEDHQ
jgi:phage FluMu protein Com